MSTIPDYPPLARPLDGTEPLPIWQDGAQRAGSATDVATFVGARIADDLEQIGTSIIAQATEQSQAAGAAAARAKQVGDTLEAASAAIVEMTIGMVPVAADGTKFGNGTVYYEPGSLSTVDTFVRVRAPIAVAGSATHVVTKVEADGSLTRVSTRSIMFTKTGDAVAPVPDTLVPVPAGCVAGLLLGTAQSYYTPGGTDLVWATVGIPDKSTPKTVTRGNKPRYRYLVTGAVTAKSQIGYDLAQANAQAIGTTTTLGWPDIVATGSDVPANYVVAVAYPAEADGMVTDVVAGCGSAGTTIILVATMDGTKVAAITQAVTLPAVPGVNTYRPALPILKAQIAYVIAPLKFQNSVNPLGVPYLFKAGGLSVGDTVTASSLHRFELGVTIKTGLLTLTATAGAGGSGGGAGAFIQPRDTRIVATDLAGTWTRIATDASAKRPISDGQGYEYASPGARLTFAVTADAASTITASLLYTGLITRPDTYNPVGTVFVGDTARDFTCPVGKAASTDPHPVANLDLPIAIPKGTSIVSILFPIAASLNLTSIALPAGVTMNAAPVSSRPTAVIVGAGDSTTHGLGKTSIRTTWLYLLTKATGRQMASLGYGGRQAVASDGTAAGRAAAAFGANAIITYSIGINDCIGGVSLAAFKASVAGFITNARAEAPLAKIVVISAFYCPAIEAIDNARYPKQIAPASSYRTQSQQAASESTAGNVSFVDGTTLITNSNDRFNGDLVHANDLGDNEIATRLRTALGL